jgi:lipopolysaccharide export system permease protein
VRLWRRHDAYVLRAYAGAFGGVLVFFTLMIVVIDLAERLKRLRENWDKVVAAGYEPYAALAKLYATFIPFLWLRLLPLIASMAAAFTLSRLSRHQELVPLVAGGVSTRRIVRPILLAGVLLAALMVVARATVVPALNRENLALQRVFTKPRPDRVVDIRHVHDAGGGRLSAAAFMPLGRRLEDAWITFRAKDGALREIRRYPLLAWDADASAWVAPQGGERVEFAAEGDGRGWFVYRIEPGERAPLASSADLLEVLYDAGNSLGLSLAQSAEMLRANPHSPDLMLRHHEQFTIPISTVVLLTLTLALTLRLGPHNPLPGLLTGLGMAALYFAATQICNDLALGGAVNPIVLAWAPTVVFGSFAAALFAGMRS